MPLDIIMVKVLLKNKKKPFSNCQDLKAFDTYQVAVIFIMQSFDSKQLSISENIQLVFIFAKDFSLHYRSVRLKALLTKLGQLIDINKDNNFQESLDNLEDWGSVPGPFQFSNLLKLFNSQLCQDCSV